jgi:hypothetical protein
MAAAKPRLDVVLERELEATIESVAAMRRRGIRVVVMRDGWVQQVAGNDDDPGFYRWARLLF